MEDSCPATPLHVLTGRDSKSPLQVAISSPESEEMKSPSERVSPDSRCVICLGKLQNKSFTDSCLHQFCFQCLLQWSKVKPECPLCKQPFKSIIHNVRSNLDYDQYHVERREPNYMLSDILQSYNFDLIPVDRRFRYRSTMTREYFREIAESFIARTHRLQDIPYQIPPLVPVDPTPASSIRRSSRLQAHTFYQRLRQRGTTEFRRSIYAQDLWVQDLPDVSGRYRDCTPQFYRDNPAQVHRVVPWLNREVNVLLNDCENHAAYVLDRILSILPQHSIRSREFREIVEPYFGNQTDHFIHEFYTFARSVYDIAGFDQNATYITNPNYSTEVQEISSSNDDSDIEVIETLRPDDSRSVTTSRRGFKKVLLKRVGESSANSDEPVAGPSGLGSAGVSEAIEICESDPDEIKVIDYVKPDPEVVTLSSGDEAAPIVLSDLDISGGEYPEMFCNSNNGANDDDTPSCRASSCEEYKPSGQPKRKKYKSTKGKCKANGFGLKGRQKRKWSRTRTSSSSSSSNSCSISSISSISSVSSVGSNFSVNSNSTSDYEPISKLTKKKKEISKSKVCRKKNKKRSSRKKTHGKKKYQEDSSDTPQKRQEVKNKRKRVKSCVVVPNSRKGSSQNGSSSRSYSYSSGISSKSSTSRRQLERFSDDDDDEDSSLPLASYWSMVSDGVKKDRRHRRNSSKDRRCPKRIKTSSSPEESRPLSEFVLRSISRVSNESRASSPGSFVDVVNTSASRGSIGSDGSKSWGYSDSRTDGSSNGDHMAPDLNSDNQLPPSSASTSGVASTASDIKLNLSLSSDMDSD